MRSGVWRAAVLSAVGRVFQREFGNETARRSLALLDVESQLAPAHPTYRWMQIRISQLLLPIALEHPISLSISSV